MAPGRMYSSRGTSALRSYSGRLPGGASLRVGAVVVSVALANLLASPAVLATELPDEGTERGVLFPPVRNESPSEPPARGTFTLGLVVPLSGEPVNGFPNWQERVMHQWVNRARVDPQADLAGCPAGNCAENIGSCYTPKDPLIWNGNAGRAARYHSAEMARQSFFDHNSACTIVANISTLYPGSCDGSASCACVGGTKTCTSGCTTPSGRLSLFGSGYSGEIIAAGYSTVDSAFYAWLWEPSSTTACSFTFENGHRYLILNATSALGAGYESVGGSPYTRYYTGDFGGSNSPIPKIPSGAHYPQQASSIDFWANWKDSAAPQSASVDIDGTCHPMTLQRGSATNGAYAATGVGGLGSGCHRYYFSFVDSGGTVVTYPSTGSYGIGTTSCADWDSSRPAACGPIAPTVTAVNQSFGPTSGGTSVTITGTGFVATPAVTFGGANATAEVFVNSTTLTAVVPAHALGLVNVVVTNPDAQAGTLTNGYYYAPAPTAASWSPVTPCRMIDTRLANAPLGGPVLSANQTRTFDLTTAPETCAVPSTAKALSVNYTVTSPQQAGEIRVFPGDALWTGTSVVSFAAGLTRLNNGHLTLPADGSGTIKVTNASNGTAHFILDVTGYYQ